ncbi:MAG: hypothetical protein UH850_02370 [Paludibacteraceae bacterium]|nr:hypothetical protein [Paludibacteraceae bacterium]
MIDIPIAINFFVRPDTLEKVLECVRSVQPKQLFLIADGPRPNCPEDEIKCIECRALVDKMVDWECEVHKYYNDKNKGLFITYFENMKKVFEIVDRCIFMEDDVVATPSFFEYCRLMLDKYKDDLRIAFVSGMTLFPGGIHPTCKYDYFFCGEGSLQAYGLWKRTFESMNMTFLKCDYSVEAAIKLAKRVKPGYDKRIRKYQKNLLWQGHIPHVEIYKNLLRILENQICILPSKNLVQNIGTTSGSTHIADDIRKLPKAKWCFYNTPTYNLNFPLKHPKYVINDVDYEDYMNYHTGWNMPFLQFHRRIEAIIRHVIYGDTKRVWKKIKLVLTGKYIFDE